MKNILAIDIGNTTISLAFMRGSRILRRFSVSSELGTSLGQAELNRVLRLLKRGSNPLERIMICSVVPNRDKFVKSALQDNLADKKQKLEIYIVGKDIVVPIENRYNDPSAVGQDRLVGAYAAKQLYGAPVIVIDFGTAITFDVISEKGAYEGGIIVPGIRLSAESLFKKTALLPNITDFHWPKTLVGKTTQDSILSGLFHGYMQMCNGLVCQLKSMFKVEPQVVLTGGYAALLKRHGNFPAVHEPDLIFKGLQLLG